MDLKESNGTNDSSSHWYYNEKYRHILKAIIKYSPSFAVLLDIGAGSAPFSTRLAKQFKTATVYAQDIGYDDSKIGTNENGITLVDSLLSADIYLLNDLLEHLEKPNLLLKDLETISSPGSLLIITVPAHEILWSGHDVFLEHFRRYNKRLLLNEFADLHLEVLEMYYLFNSLFLPALIRRRLKGKEVKSQMKFHSHFGNFIIRTIVGVDIIFRKHAPFGISLFCVARFTSKI